MSELRVSKIWCRVRGGLRGGVAAVCGTLFLLALSPSPATAQEAHLEILSEKFQEELEGITRDVRGVMGVSILDLTTGQHFGVNEDLVFPQGSSIKIPILIELYRQANAGELRLDERLPITTGEMAGGSGILKYFGDGESEVSLRDLGVLMIVLSDNTATNLLIDRVGMERVNATMAELGLPSIRLQRRMIRPQDSAAGRENVATPREAAELMRRIASCELPMSGELCGEVRSVLEFPKTVPGEVPSTVKRAWKGGSIQGVRAGWGIVDLPGRPYAVGVMVNYSDGAEAGVAIDEAATAAYRYFSLLAGATPHGTRVPLRHLIGVVE